MNAPVTSINGERGLERLERVVLQFGGRVLRGFAARSALEGASGSGAAPESLPFQPLGSEHTEEISLQGVKAVFFVKRFDGPGLDEMRFHDHLDPMASVWVRVVFADGEIIEGLVDNRGDYILQPGFFLTPTDPEANHWLIYVVKEQVRDFQVLGLRSASRS